MSEFAKKFTEYTAPLTINKPANQDKVPAISTLFYELFEVGIAQTPEDQEKAHRLRYQVFCVERDGFEDPDSHPDEKESDGFDSHAQHVLLSYKPTGQPLGTIRVILPTPEAVQQSFPIQNLCTTPELVDPKKILKSCEISRFCISTAAREAVKGDLDEKAERFPAAAAFLKKALSLASVGLVSGIFHIAACHQVLNCYAVMRQIDLHRLTNVGLRHRRIGENIEFHGERVPFVVNLAETLAYTKENHPNIWDIISRGGQYHTMAEEPARPLLDNNVRHLTFK